MKKSKRFVLDTNVLVSAALFSNSVPALAVKKAFNIGTVMVSEECLEELLRVLIDEKFEKYAPFKERMLFLQWIKKSSELVNVIEKVVLCRDPKDNKFLSLAVSANAECIVSGDNDLLILNPFKNISIITPAEFIEVF